MLDPRPAREEPEPGVAAHTNEKGVLRLPHFRGSAHYPRPPRHDPRLGAHPVDPRPFATEFDSGSALPCCGATANGVPSTCPDVLPTSSVRKSRLLRTRQREPGPSSAAPKKPSLAAAPSPKGCERAFVPELLAPEVADLFPDYLGRCQSDVAVLENLLAQQQFHAISVMGHKLKGTAPSFGMPLIGRLGGLLEQAARRADTDAVRTLATDLQSHMAELRPLLANSNRSQEPVQSLSRENS